MGVKYLQIQIPLQIMKLGNLFVGSQSWHFDHDALEYFTVYESVYFSFEWPFVQLYISAANCMQIVCGSEGTLRNIF